MLAMLSNVDLFEISYLKNDIQKNPNFVTIFLNKEGDIFHNLRNKSVRTM